MRRIATLTGALLAWAVPLLAHAQPKPVEFPLKFDFNDSKQRWANQSPIDGHSVSEWTDSCGRTGGGIHMKGTGAEADQMRVWRKVIPDPPIARQLHLTAWVKGAGVDNVAAVVMQAHAPRSAYLAGYASTQIEQPLKGDFDWTELKATLDVPRGCANVQVLLMLVGNGEVWFDDVSIELGGESTLIVPGIFEVRSGFSVASSDPGVTTATLLMPVPLAYRDQVPLSYELNVDPGERLASSRLYEDTPGNWVAELKLKDITSEPETAVSWTSIVLAAPTDFTTAPSTAPMPTEWPEEARAWLRSTRSAQSDDPTIRLVATEAKGDSNDVMAIIFGTIARARQVYADQEGRCTELDAIQALTKHGSCTSCANLVTALLRANGIPARIVAGYPAWSGPLQTHYIVEAYVPTYGWYPIESSLLRAPWPSHQHIAVSIVPPEYEDRSAARPAAAGGVPYLSLTEHVPSEAPIRTLGTLGKPGTWCDHECIAVRNFAESTSAEEWSRMMLRARARWADRLKGEVTKSPESLSASPAPEWYRAATEDEVKRSLLQE